MADVAMVLWNQAPSVLPFYPNINPTVPGQEVDDLTSGGGGGGARAGPGRARHAGARVAAAQARRLGHSTATLTTGRA